MELYESDVIVRCFRCKEPRGFDDLTECPLCNAMTCGLIPCNGRCMCEGIRLSVWPECRAYYDLLDCLSDGEESASIEEELTRWEDEFKDRGL